MIRKRKSIYRQHGGLIKKRIVVYLYKSLKDRPKRNVTLLVFFEFLVLTKQCVVQTKDDFERMTENDRNENITNK